jgi:hypothetical protein
MHGIQVNRLPIRILKPYPRFYELKDTDTTTKRIPTLKRHGLDNSHKAIWDEEFTIPKGFQTMG